MFVVTSVVWVVSDSASQESESGGAKGATESKKEKRMGKMGAGQGWLGWKEERREGWDWTGRWSEKEADWQEPAGLAGLVDWPDEPGEP